MINETTRRRLADLTDEYRSLTRTHPEALEQIALAELAEGVQQSNAIENSTLSLDDTERILAGRLPVRGSDLREVYEARNLAAVTTDMLSRRDPLTIALILQWHGSLMAGIRDDIAGRFRRGDEWVRVGGHVGANPAFVPDLLTDALRRFHDEAEGAPIDAIARFHCEFEIIHPFVDGNGRIGRVLINKQLQDAHLPPVIIRARNRMADYYPLFVQYGRSDDAGGMTRLIAVLLMEAVHKRLAMIGSPRIISLSDWARANGVRGTVAANKAKRQTLPAFRVRDRWMIAEDHRP
ncbi:Fic family protein [Microbacterium resistens]